MAALAERDVTAGAVGRIVGGMAVIGGHGMPKRAPCRTESEGMLETLARQYRIDWILERGDRTDTFAMAATRRGSEKTGVREGGHWRPRTDGRWEGEGERREREVKRGREEEEKNKRSGFLRGRERVQLVRFSKEGREKYDTVEPTSP